MLIMPETVYLIGCGGHARSVADVLLANDPSTEIVFVDENARMGEKILGHTVCKKLPPDACYVHIALGDSLIREQKFLVGQLTIISKDCYVSPSACMGDGVFIGHSAHIGPEAKIGDGCIINTRSIIEHECQVGAFSHISVNTTLLGRAIVGSRVFVGAGSIIRNSIKICNDVTIGAGAVVVKDITIPGVYIGTPARLLKLHQVG